MESKGASPPAAIAGYERLFTSEALRNRKKEDGLKYWTLDGDDDRG